MRTSLGALEFFLLICFGTALICSIFADAMGVSFSAGSEALYCVLVGGLLAACAAFSQVPRVFVWVIVTGTVGRAAMPILSDWAQQAYNAAPYASNLAWYGQEWVQTLIIVACILAPLVVHIWKLND